MDDLYAGDGFYAGSVVYPDECTQRWRVRAATAMTSTHPRVHTEDTTHRRCLMRDTTEWQYWHEFCFEVGEDDMSMSAALSYFRPAPMSMVTEVCGQKCPPPRSNDGDGCANGDKKRPASSLDEEDVCWLCLDAEHESGSPFVVTVLAAVGRGGHISHALWITRNKRPSSGMALTSMTS